MVALCVGNCNELLFSVKTPTKRKMRNKRHQHIVSDGLNDEDICSVENNGEFPKTIVGKQFVERQGHQHDPNDHTNKWTKFRNSSQRVPNKKSKGQKTVNTNRKVNNTMLENNAKQEIIIGQNESTNDQKVKKQQMKPNQSNEQKVKEGNQSEQVKEEDISSKEPTSWADLFEKGNLSNAAPSQSKQIFAYSSINEEVAIVSNEAKKNKVLKKKKEENILTSNDIQFDEKAEVFIIPRGLINMGNSCYINAAMQALLYIPEFYNLCKKLGTMGLSREIYPLTRAIVQFVDEFRFMGKSKTHIDIGAPLVPTSILNYMKNVNTDVLRQGEQHDVHEFLLFLLQEFHSELIKTSAILNKTETLDQIEAHILTEQQNLEDHDEGCWQEVGKKNKASNIREIKHDESPISKIFSGKLRSLFKKRSVMGSLTLQPFYSLHLPIEEPYLKSLKDSLKHITVSERLENASMHFAVEELPKILILQLIRFKFEGNKNIKIGKHIEFPAQLYLDKNVMSPTKIKENDKRRYFNLKAVLCHHGKEASGGHYSTFVYHPSKKWIHLDDQSVNFVTLDHVLKQQAYILIYSQAEQPVTRN